MIHLSRTRIAAAADGRGEPRPAAGAILAEVLSPASRDGAATGFVLSRLPRAGGPVLWVQDRLSRREAGRPVAPCLSGRLWRMALSHPRDVLAAAEEGLRCAALSAVVAELHGDPPALDFTATKRLALRAAESGVPCWLIRHAGNAGLSAARDRWRVESLPSAAHPDDPAAPGAPRWKAELFRSRDGRPGEWVVQHDLAQDRVHFAAPLPDGAVAATDRPDRRRAAR